MRRRPIEYQLLPFPPVPLFAPAARPVPACLNAAGHMARHARSDKPFPIGRRSDRRVLVVARRPGRHAARAASARREALLRLVCPLPRRPEPPRSDHPDRGAADRGRSCAPCPSYRTACAPTRPATASTRCRRSPARHGLTVIQGIWLGGIAEYNRQDIEAATALARRYPQVIQAIVVGNEVLLRGEMAAPPTSSPPSGG